MLYILTMSDELSVFKPNTTHNISDWGDWRKTILSLIFQILYFKSYQISPCKIHDAIEDMTIPCWIMILHNIISCIISQFSENCGISCKK